ncbi:response regulator transcription factor [Siccirubricoccus sp. KC 17139]|uniref:Response regulator transcription factor n=1 Tax=Siccirubricoccus soli TaxID=2899147 RepID=A0ABT1D7B4_9PROT|nr:response regulator transcription factor [Siccirubricoccus soli]MCO6417821.1 response regulator transcription factor [Siccirubricoccus soli]MCP2683956.1 response regulator transcription factor [Siccirubricoccus soli]
MQRRILSARHPFRCCAMKTWRRTRRTGRRIFGNGGSAVQETSATGPHRIVLVLDQQALRRASIAAFLQDWALGNRVVVETGPADMTDAVVTAGKRIALCILNVGGMSVEESSPSEWLKAANASLPETPLVVVSDRESPSAIIAALRAGVRGFIGTSTEPRLALAAFTFIMNGGWYFPPSALLGPWSITASAGHSPNGRNGNESVDRRLHALTREQLAVLSHMRSGMPNRQIAALLGISEASVKVHVRQVMRKLGVSNRTAAALASSGTALATAHGAEEAGMPAAPIRLAPAAARVAMGALAAPPHGAVPRGPEP